MPLVNHASEERKLVLCSFANLLTIHPEVYQDEKYVTTLK